MRYEASEVYTRYSILSHEIRVCLRACMENERIQNARMFKVVCGKREHRRALKRVSVCGEYLVWEAKGIGCRLSVGLAII